MNRSVIARRAPEAALLGAILALAAVLRFASLPYRGLIYWDEGKFALEGIRLESLLRVLTGAHADLLAGKAVGTAKPMHALLIALAYGIFGIHDYAALYVNAIAGVISVALTYAIGRRLFGPAVALFGAALLAVSEYEAVYARSALSESDATVFYLAGVLLWLSRLFPQRLTGGRGALLRTGGAGLLLGIGFTTNYRLIIYIAVVVAIDLVLTYRDAGLQPAFLVGAAWGGGLLVAPILWELAGPLAQARGLALYRGEVIRDSLPYWREVVYQLHQGKQSDLHFNPVIYLQWWVLRQGWPASLLLLAALIRAFWVRSSAWLIPATLVLAPYVVYSFAPFVVPRNLVPALPFTSMLIAALVVDAARRLNSLARASVVLLCLALLGFGASMSWRLSAVRSGFVPAVRYVERRDGGLALTSSEIVVFYLRGSGSTCAAPAFPYRIWDLRAYIRQGYRYAILDRHNNSHLSIRTRILEPEVARFSALGPVNLGESLISSENTDPPNGDTSAEDVGVYYLNPSRLPRSHPGHPGPCRRDRVV